MDTNRLTKALETLGTLLQERGHAAELAVVGGAAIMLQHFTSRPTTADVDTIAQRQDGRWIAARPLTRQLQSAVAEVGSLLGLETPDKEWLNSGPSMLFDRPGLPDGFFERATRLRFGALTLWLAGRRDLVFFKLLAATDAGRGSRRRIDEQDLRELTPTRSEILAAAAWCKQFDGRPDFVELDLLPVIHRLGHTGVEAADVHD